MKLKYLLFIVMIRGITCTSILHIDLPINGTAIPCDIEPLQDKHLKSGIKCKVWLPTSDGKHYTSFIIRKLSGLIEKLSGLDNEIGSEYWLSLTQFKATSKTNIAIPWARHEELYLFSLNCTWPQFIQLNIIQRIQGYISEASKNIRQTQVATSSSDPIKSEATQSIRPPKMRPVFWLYPTVSARPDLYDHFYNQAPIVQTTNSVLEYLTKDVCQKRPINEKLTSTILSFGMNQDQQQSTLSQPKAEQEKTQWTGLVDDDTKSITDPDNCQKLKNYMFFDPDQLTWLATENGYEKSTKDNQPIPKNWFFKIKINSMPPFPYYIRDGQTSSTKINNRQDFERYISTHSQLGFYFFYPNSDMAQLFFNNVICSIIEINPGNSLNDWQQNYNIFMKLLNQEKLHIPETYKENFTKWCTICSAKNDITLNVLRAVLIRSNYPAQISKVPSNFGSSVAIDYSKIGLIRKVSIVEILSGISGGLVNPRPISFVGSQNISKAISEGWSHCTDKKWTIWAVWPKDNSVDDNTDRAPKKYDKRYIVTINVLPEMEATQAFRHQRFDSSSKFKGVSLTLDIRSLIIYDALGNPWGIDDIRNIHDRTGFFDKTIAKEYMRLLSRLTWAREHAANPQDLGMLKYLIQMKAQND